MTKLTQAEGSLTIVDFNDAPMLQGALDVTNGVTTQIYKADSSTYNQGNDWTIDNLEIVPKLYISGVTPIEVCNDPSYTVTIVYEENISTSGVFSTIDVSGNPSFEFIDTNNNGRFGIKVIDNILGTNSKQGIIRAKITFTDPNTGLSTTSIVSLNVNVFSTQKGAVALILTSDNGLTFKNASTDANEDITLTATLMRGSTVDDTHLTYVWKQDDVVVGGNSNTFVLKATDVYSKTIIRCTVSDSIENDEYSASVAILDVTDPIQVNLSSDIGTVFKQGESATATITANLYRGGTPFTAPAGSGFLWSLDGKNGANADFYNNSAVNVGPLDGTGVSGGHLVNGLTTTNLKVGYLVSGTGVPTGTRINRIVSDKVYFTNLLTENGTSYTFTLPASEKVTTLNHTTVSDKDITVRGTITCKVMI